MEEENEDCLVLDIEDQDPSHVFTLDLSEKRLLSIPKFVRKYKHCKSLKLSCNLIKSIKEDDIASCTQLKELKLYGNKLESVNGLSRLPRLEELHLQHNNIKSFGDAVKSNKELRNLRLDCNKLTEIRLSEVCMLGKLTRIDLSSNKLEEIAFVSSLTSLEELICTHNQLKKLPKLCSLKKLKEVDFSSNCLNEVDGLYNCLSLQIITLSCNKLKDLYSVGSLKNLQELKVNGNSVYDLEHIVVQFASLEVLDISSNSVTSASQINFLFTLGKTLKELSLSDNPFLNGLENKNKLYDHIRNNLKLDVLDGLIVNMDKSNFTPSVLMRPMSATKIISKQTIEYEMELNALQMADLEKTIKCRFDDLKASLKELPSSYKPPNTKLVDIVDSKMDFKTGNLEERPVSRCSSRARLDEARAFAKENFVS